MHNVSEWKGSRLTKPCGDQLLSGGSVQSNAIRWYVVDETIGSEDVLCAFKSLGNMPNSDEIRIEGGKVRCVHTITV